jgi:hypothetical protein
LFANLCQEFRSEALRPVVAAVFSLLRTKKFSPRLQCDTGYFLNALRSVRLTRGGFLRHCLACGRALQNCVRRASQLTHNLQTTANSRTAREAAQAREAPGGRAPIRAGFISASEDEP